MLTDLLYVVALPGEQEVLPIKKAEEESKTGKIPTGFLVPQPRIDISLAGMGCVALPYYGRAEEDRALCIWRGRSGDRPPPVTFTAGCAMLCSLSGLASSWACLASRPTPGLALDGEMLMRGEATGTLQGQPPPLPGWGDQLVRRLGRRGGAGSLSAAWGGAVHPAWGSLPGLVGLTALLSVMNFPTCPFSPGAFISKGSQLGRE